MQNSMVMFLFWAGNTFIEQIWFKNQFNLEFGTWTNSNMKNSMVMFIFSVFDWKCPFLRLFLSKNHYCLLNLKFRP